MKYRLYILIGLGLVFFVMTIENIQAQFQNMNFEYLKIDNGLSHNRVQCFLRDSKGYLWIGTQDGLNKYDGQKITILKNNPFETNSLSNNNIQCIFEDRSHNIWIGTNVGLNLYDRKADAIKRISPNSNIKNSNINIIEADNRIYSIVEDSKGNIWYSTLYSLFRWNPLKRNFTKYNIPRKENNSKMITINSIICDNKGFLWFGTQDDKIWRLNLTTLQFDSFTYPFLSSTSIIEKIIVQDKSGMIWIGTDGKGLISFNPDTKRFKQYTALGDGKGTNGPFIHSLFLDENHYLYISVDLGGINRLDLQSGVFEYCVVDEKNENGLNSNGVRTIYKDYEGILYAGTSVAGANIFNPNKYRFKTYRHNANNNSLIYNVVFKFFEDSKGLIWIGTDGGGLSVFDPIRKSFKNYQYNAADPYSISRNTVLAITEDKNQDIWLGIWGSGMNRFDRKTGRFFHYSPNPDDPRAISFNTIWDLITDENGNIWISYNWRGIDVYNTHKGVIQKYRSDSTDPNFYCPEMTNRFIHQNNGKIGFATQKGYYIWDGISNKLSPVGILEGFDLNDVCLDKNSNYWAGTANNGLIIVKPDGKADKYNESNGFPSNSISGILEDSHGNIWVLTSSGLAEFFGQSGKFHFFNFFDGLQGKQFTSFARLKAKDGNFYIGGFNGFNVFTPEQIKQSSYSPPVYIDEFKIFNEPVSIDSLHSPLKQSIAETKEIVLTYKQSVFSFGFTALNFTSPENVIYAYKMEGYDEKWNYTNFSLRNISYTNLDPGEYTFMVKATNNDGVWNETPTSIKITIKPPFWKTWWFKILTTILIAGAIISMYRIRINQLKHQKSILTQKVKERTAELHEANILLEENQEEILKQYDTLEVKNFELENKNQEIIHITNLLHESDQMKIRFFTNISHDLRTPLTLILGYLESIISGITNNKSLSDRLNIVINNSNRLLRLVNQLLDFQKIDAESLKLQPEFLDIILFIHNIFDSFRLQAEERKIEYTIILARDFLMTWFDPDKLDKILFNLLSNAFKFTPDSGKITLELDFEDIDQADDKASGVLKIRVIDSGVGIQEKDLNKIFDRFYQADNSLIGKHTGSGIGLALAKHLSEIHHGSISVNSEPGKGSCFEVVLIIGKSLEVFAAIPEKSSYIPQPEITRYSLTTPIKTYSETIEKPTILVVEDNDELRRFICDELAFKYRILEAGNGKRGAEIATFEQPDLVISDVMMPYMDGFEMCEKLKMEWQTSHIPIILLTSKADEESLYRGIEAGAEAYIRKPFHLKHLSIQIENLLANRRKLFDKFSKNPVEELKKNSTNSNDNLFLDKLYQVIESHLDDNNFGVEELAAEVNMSRSQLYKKTFPILNISAGELIRTFRLKKAAEFLLDKNIAVSEVAFLVGFADHPQFTRSFNNLYGITPKQFQTQKNEDKYKHE